MQVQLEGRLAAACHPPTNLLWNEWSTEATADYPRPSFSPRHLCLVLLTCSDHLASPDRPTGSTEHCPPSCSGCWAPPAPLYEARCMQAERPTLGPTVPHDLARTTSFPWQVMTPRERVLCLSHSLGTPSFKTWGQKHSPAPWTAPRLRIPPAGLSQAGQRGPWTPPMR